jgi:hypothetical protein
MRKDIWFILENNLTGSFLLASLTPERGFEFLTSARIPLTIVVEMYA